MKSRDQRPDLMRTATVGDTPEQPLRVRKASGPRTPEGKQRSKYNALKHGIFSKSVLLKGESASEFNSLLNGLRNDFRPEGALEEILVEKLASLLWRYRRLLIAEGAEIRRGTECYSLDKSERDEQEAAIFLRSEGKARAGLYSRIENPLIRDRCMEILRFLKESIELWGFDSSIDTPLLTVLFGDVEMTAPTVSLVLSYKLCTRNGKYPDLKELNKLEEVNIPKEAKNLIENLATPEGRKARFLQALQSQIDLLQGLPKWLDRITDPREELDSLRRNVPDAPALDRLLRYDVTLDRSFDRTLTQLERLQRMRLGQLVPPPVKVEIS